MDDKEHYLRTLSDLLYDAVHLLNHVNFCLKFRTECFLAIFQAP